MTDSVLYKQSTNTSDPKIDTDEVIRGGLTVHQQVVKLSVGADGATSLLAFGQAAAAASLSVVLASDQPALSVTVSGTVTIAGAVTNAGTFAVQESGAALTSLQLIDDTVATVTAAVPTKGLAMAGTDGTNARLVKTDAAGELQVDVLTLPANASVNVAQINGVAPLMGAGVTGTGSHRVTIATDGQGQVVDNAGFTDGTTRLDIAGYIFDEVAGTALTENDAAAARIDAKRAQVFVLEDATTRGQRAAVNVSGGLAVNLMNLNGNTFASSNGSVSSGTPRVTIADDCTGQIAPVPKTSGGLSASKTISAATTNATSVKGSAGQVYTILAHNTNAAVRYLKLYNKATAPTVGSDTPVLTLPIPGNTAGAGFVLDTGGMGIAFGTGIGFALTTGVADADTGAVAANEIVVNILYK